METDPNAHAKFADDRFSLPMRDGNDLQAHRDSLLDLSFSLPMRDGNRRCLAVSVDENLKF